MAIFKKYEAVIKPEDSTGPAYASWKESKDGDHYSAEEVDKFLYKLKQEVDPIIRNARIIEHYLGDKIK